MNWFAGPAPYQASSEAAAQRGLIPGAKKRASDSGFRSGLTTTRLGVSLPLLSQVVVKRLAPVARAKKKTPMQPVGFARFGPEGLEELVDARFF